MHAFHDRDRLSSAIRPQAKIPPSSVVGYGKTFAYQSYLDSTLLETAILNQPAGQQIVPSTLDASQAQLPGYVFGLHPASETPIAVQFIGPSGTAGATYIMRPGDVVRPYKEGFKGFNWGLPFGWLGGGLARAVILPADAGDLQWQRTAGDLLFHRLRLPVYAANATIAAAPNPNFPLRFPWKNAFFGAIQQYGTPSFVVTPTKLLARLRFVGASVTIRFLCFDQDVLIDNATLDDDLSQGYVDVTFPSTTATTLTVNGVTAGTTEFPIIALDEYLAKLGGDAAYVLPVDINSVMGGGKYIDLFRYGKLD